MAMIKAGQRNFSFRNGLHISKWDLFRRVEQLLTVRKFSTRLQLTHRQLKFALLLDQAIKPVHLEQQKRFLFFHSKTIGNPGEVS